MLQPTIKIVLITYLFMLITCDPVNPCIQDCSNCTHCSDCANKLCNSCYGGYLLIPAVLPKPGVVVMGLTITPPVLAVDAYCRKCSVNNCSTCSPTVSTCTQCLPNFGLVNNTCLPCVDENCQLCKLDIEVCTQCNPWYGFNQTICVKCQDQSCYICSANYTQCTQCFNRTGVNELNGCSECEHQNCSYCYFNYTKCVICIDGGPGSNGICQPCSSDLCLKCPSDINRCTECSNNSFLQNMKCLPCVAQNCGYCKNGTNDCQYCMQGFGWSEPNGWANKLNCSCQLPCQTCNGLSQFYCQTCSNDSYLQINSTFIHNFFINQCFKCSVKIPKCISCDNSTYCTECQIGYYLSAFDNLCHTCPFECTECKWSADIQSPQCQECIQESLLTIHRPFLCGRYCGEKIKIGVRCNFEQGVKYDGCTDECVVQDGFECFYQPLQVVSELCSYTKRLKMNIVSIVKQKLRNRIVIKMIVDPILHVLTVLNSSNIFFFDSNTLTKVSVDFENSTGEMIFVADFNESLYNKNLQVFFKPSKQLDQRFYQTPQSQTSLQIVELTFYSNFQLTVGKIIFGLSYVAVGLGWSNIALGLVSKRLAGIENFVLFQIAFLTFMWIDLPLNEPLSQTDSLRHLNLPKIKELLSSQGLDQLSFGNITDVNPYSYSETFSKSPPHISNFDFQLSSFANNFNMALIFQMVPLFFFMIFTLVNCVFKYKIAKIIQETGDIPYTDEFTDSEYLKLKNNVSKVEKGKQLSAQFLMCFTTLNMIGLANSLVLFLKYSAPPFTMNELIAIGISGGMFIITIILYFCDPDPFDYFRYAFRKQMLPLLTYFFFLATFVSTIVLFFMFPHLSWTAMIPFSVFFVYILAYRPYKQTKENYRAAFFILVILFVLSFRVFLQYSNKEQNKMASYIYSLLIVVVLVLIGFGTMIFLIYKIVYFCYILPNLEKSEKVKIMQEIDITTIRQKMKFSNAEGSVFHQLMRNQMNIMDFSNSMRNLAVENNLDTENPNQQNLITNKKKNAWKQQPHTGKNRNKNVEQNSRIQNEDIQFHQNFYNDLQKQNEKIHQNIDENFEQYVKNRQEEEIECQGQDGKQRRKKNFALQILAEQNSFLGLKNAEQYVQEKKGEIKDKNIFMDQYQKIE